MSKSSPHIKSRKHPSASLIAAATVASLGLPAAHAQVAAETTLQEVKVQATQETGYAPAPLASPKYTAPLAETTQTIQVINEQVLKDQSATTLTEALRNIPGAGTFNAGEGNGGPTMGDAIYMRGFDASNSIYVDGVRDLGTLSREMFNIEALEVTKGAAGTDYGRSSPAGSINLVTKQANLENSFSGSLGLGSGQYKRTTADLNRKLGDTTAVRLNVMGQEAGVAGRDEVKNDRWGIAASLGLGLGTSTRAFLDVLHVKQTNTPESGVPLIGWSGHAGANADRNTAAKVDSSNYYGSSDSHDNSTASMLTVRLEQDFGADTTLRNTTRWGRNKDDYLALTAGGITSTDPDPKNWTISRLGAAKQLENEILTNQTNLTTKFKTGNVEHSLSAGLELTREEQTNYGLNKVGTIPAVNLYNPALTHSGLTFTRNGHDGKWTTNTAALYAFDTLKLNEQWQANAGLRYDRYKTKYHTSNATSTTDLDASGHLLTYKLGALYKLAPNGNIYANYALSQLPPGGTASFGAYALSANANNANNPNMDPQKSKTLELGTKWELLDQRLLLAGALFRTEITNEVYTEDDGTITQGGKKRVQGIELSATGQITKDWNVIAAYTLQKTKVAKGAAMTEDGSDSLPHAPKSAFSLWSTYRMPMGLTVGGGARYTASIKREVKNATTPSVIPSYWVADAMVSYQVNKNLDLQLNVFNLFNKKYMTSMNKLGFRYTPGLERSERLTANFKF